MTDRQTDRQTDGQTDEPPVVFVEPPVVFVTDGRTDRRIKGV